MADRNNPQLQGVVQRVDGKAWLRTPDGKLVELLPGEHIVAGQTIVIDASGHVVLERANGSPIELGPNRTVTIDNDMLGQSAPDRSETTVVPPAAADAESIINALNEGRDPFADIDPAAAGLIAGGQDSGHSFVRLLRIVEELSPLSIETDRPAFGNDTILPNAIGNTDTGTVATAPTASNVSTQNVMEGNDLVFQVALDHAGTTPTTLPFSLAGGTASASDIGTPVFSDGVVYDPVTSTVTIPAGVSSFTVTIPTTQDTTDEPDETVVLTVGGVSATGTIIDDDGVPTITGITNPTTSEGGDLVYAVTLSNANTAVTTFPFSLGGTAGSGDYGAPVFSDGVTLSGGVLSIPAGVSSFTVTIPTTDDVYAEAPETVLMTIDTHTATGTIIDDSDATTLGLTATPSVAEGGSITYTATLSNPAGTAMAVTLSNGAVINIAAGSTNGAVSVAAPGDDPYVDASTVSASIASTTGGNFENLLVSAAAASTSVTDTIDTTTATLTATPVVIEGNTVTYTVALTAPVTGSAVSVTLSNGLTVTIPVGASSGTATSSAPDDVYAGGGSLSANITGISGGNYENLVFNPAPANTSVVDDADVTTVTLTAPTSVTEGGTVTYTATVSNAVTGSPLDITLSNGQHIIIPVGSTSATSAPFAVRADDVYTEGTQALPVSISTTSGGNYEALDTTSAVSTNVVDDADNTTVSLSATASVAEGGNIVYTASLTNPAGTAMTVTLSNGAIINIAAGASSGTASVVAPSDDPYVDAGSVSATISSTNGGNFENLIASPTAATTSVTDTIDTTAVTLSAAPSVVEGGSITYTATVSNAVTGGPLDITLSNGQHIIIPVGSTSATSAPFAVRADDAYIQGTQVVSVGISTTSGGNYEALNTTSTVSTNVVDDADATTVVLSAASSVTEGGTVTYTATVSNTVTGSPLVVNLSNGQSITIPVGATSASSTPFAVRADDAYVQGNQIVSVGIGSTSGGNYEALNTSSTVSTTVSDDGDITNITLSAPASVTEGGSITYTATVSNAVTGSPLVITLSGGTTITIPVGSTTGSSAPVAVRADDVYVQGSVPTVVGIIGTSGGNYEALNTTSTASTNVVDDSDATTVTLSAAPSVTEGGTITYTATVSNAVTGSPLDITLSNGQHIIIPVGSTSTTSAPFAVRADDAYVQGTQVVSVGISTTSGGNYEALTTTSTVSTNVVDDADATTVTLSAAPSVTEGGSITYTATVSNAVTGSPLVINLSNGQNITIPVGATSASSAPFAVRADDVYVQGTQVVSVGITGSSGGNYEALDTTSTASTNVVDDADASTVTLSAAASVTEGGSITYTATVSNAVTGSPLVLNLSNGQTITIPVGSTSASSAPFTVRADDVYTQGTQTLTVGIASSSGGNYEALTTTSTASTDVVDDADATTVTLSAAPSVTEGGSITYTATVSNAVTGAPLVVTLSNGQTITIPVGSTAATSAPFAVRADDAYVEGTQTLTVGITGTSGGNYEALTTTSTVSTNVVDDADATTVTLSAASSVTEGGSITYTATVGNAVTGTPLVINLTNGQTITIPVGSTSASSAPFAVRADDAYVQGTQTLNVGIASTSGGNYEALTTTSTASTSVVDDSDATNLTLSATPTVAEGGSVVYTATLSNPAGTAMTVTLSNGAVINIAAGASSGTVSVAAPSDDVYIDAGSVSATINTTAGGNFENLVVSSAPATTSITDTIDTVTATLTATPSVVEGGSITYTVSLPNPVTVTPVSVTLSNGASITIPVGASSGTATITAADNVYLGGGSASATISTISGGNYENLVASGTPAVTTITDDSDATNLTLSATPSVAEGGSIVYTATLSNPAGTAMTVTLSNGGATITIPAGALSGSVSVAAPGDDVYLDAGSVSRTIVSTTGGNFESLVVSPAAATTSVTDTIDTVTATLTATPSVVEGGNITYTVSLPNPVTVTPVTVTLSNGANITIPVGASSGTASVTAADNVYLGGGSASATISTISGGNFENLVASGTPVTTTITDDSDTTNLSLSATSTVAEGGSIVYTATLSNPAGTAMTVTLSNGATINIAAGTSSGTVSVAAPSDDVYVDAGSVSATISSAAGGNFENLAVSPAAATTSVTDTIDTTTVSIAGAASINEGASGSYTVSLTSPALTAVTVTLSYSGTATGSGTDYTGVTTVTIPAGASSANFSIATINDSLAEGTENFTISLVSASGGNFENLVLASGAGSSVTTNIIDDDVATVSLAATPSLTEAGGTIVYTATITQAPVSAMTVTLSNGATITIPAGGFSGTVNVPLAASDDVYVDPSSVSANISSTSGGGILVSVNPTPAVTSITDTIDTVTATLSATPSVVEGGAITYTVNLPNPVTGSAVNVTLSNGANISIPVGASSGTTTVTAADNVYIGGGSASATISTISGGNFENLVASSTPANTTITDDADTTTVSLTATPSVAEGGNITYTASLSNPAGTAMTVTLSNGAIINIAAGASSGTVSVAAPGDDPYVDAGNVSATIASTSGGNFENLAVSATPAVTAVTDTINATVVTLSAAVSVTEGGTITYTATVSNAVTGSPLDITLSNGQHIIIPVGSTSATSAPFAVRADDAYVEGTQVVSVGISTTSGGNYEALNTTSTVSTNVIDDADATTVTLSAAASVTEGGAITYTATVSNAVTGSPLVVNLSNGQTITIPVGSTSASSTPFAVRADDAYVQGNQIVSVGISSTSGGNYEALNTSSAVSTTVSDDGDITNVTLSAAPSVTEGGSITYTATVSNAVTGSPLVINLSNGQNITIPVGSTSASSAPFAVRADDAYVEGTQIVSVGINSTTGGNYEALNTTSTASTNVVDDADATTVTLSAAASVTEGGAITYTATVSNAVTGSPLVITLSNSQTITIPVGATSATSAPFTVRADDAYVEGTQVVSVGISSTTGGNYEALTTTSTVSTNVVDDADATTVTLSAAASVTEGGNITYTATVSNAVTGSPLVINLSNGQNITIPVGATSATSVPVAVRTDDAYVEGTQVVTVGITGTSGGNYEALTTTSTVSTNVVDDADATTVTLSAASSVTEGGSITYTATVNNAVTGTPLDITLSNGQHIIIPVGSTSATSAPFAVRADDVYVQGTQAISVGISATSGGNYEALTTTSTVSTNVVDDSDATNLSLSATPSVAEGGSIVYTASLSNPAGTAMTVTLSNGAIINIAAGASSGTISVAAPSDDVYLDAGSVSATISGTTGGNFENLAVSSTPATTSVTDTVDTTTLSITGAASITEGASGSYTLSLTSPAQTSAVTVTLSYSGTASNGSDYTGVTTVTIPAGSSSANFSLSTIDDVVFEGTETITVSVVSATGGNFENLVVSGSAGSVTTNLLDNDTAPVLAVSSPTVLESAGFAQFTVSLSNPTTTATTFSLALANGTATGGGVDYGSGGASNLQISTDGGTTWTNATAVTIAAGATSALVRTPVTDDALNESAENFTLTATRTAGSTSNASAIGTATITDNDATPSLVINDVTVNEAAGTATFTVTLSAPSGQTVTVGYNTSDGSATAGSDYTAASGTLTFSPGVTTQTITVNIANDATYEGSESFNLNLSSPVNATIADNLGIGTIKDDGTGAGGTDNDLPALSVSSPSVLESAGFAQFTVSLTNPTTTATTLSLALANGTATGAGVDYGAAGATNLQVSTDGGTTWNNATTATIAAGTTSVFVRTPITDDAIAESSENFTLTATRTAGSTSNASAIGTASITDNDGVPTIASVSSASATEATSIVHTVTLSNPSASTTTYSLSLADVSATGGGVDYTSTLTNAAFSNGVTIAGGTISVPAGVTSFTVTIPTTSDTIDEPNETYTLNVGGTSGTGTIIDDDAAPVISAVSSNSATEASNIVHTVTLSNASSVATTYSLSLTDGSATGGGVDYTSALTNAAFSNGVTISGGTITVPAGVTSFTVTIPTTADTIDEPNETYTLNVGSASGTGTINDDDAAPVISSVSSAAATEAANIVHTVTLSNASSVATTYSLSLTDGTATGGGTDYTSALTSAAFSNGVTISGGVITVPAGVTSFTVSVPTTADTIDEPNETYTLTVGAASGTGTINDDDAAPVIQSVTSPSVNEGTNLIYTVTLSNASSTSVTFPYSLGGGTATATTDYSTTATFSNGVTLAAGVLTIPAGVTSFTITVPTVSDTIDEPNETVPVTVGGVTGTGTILDDDAAPTISSVSSNSATEASNIVHTVTLSNASSVATTYSLSLADVSATGGGIDYTSALTNAAFSNGVTIAGGIITVPAGVTSFTVSVPTTADTIDEPNETYTLTVGSASGTGTINDDDAAPTISSVTSASATEAANIVHTVTLSNASSVATTYTLSLADVTATGGGVDYTTALTNAAFSNGVTISGGVITVPAGVTSFTVSVPTTSDTIDEPNETYTLTVGGTSGTGTINDDDAAPTISSVTSASATEASNIVHTVTLSNASSSATTYTLSLADVTATGGGVDYTSTLTNAAFSNGVTISGGTITVPAGVTSFTVSVPTTADTIDEPNETYTLTVGGASGTGTINDDDATPTISSVSSAAATEASNIVHTVTLSNASSVATTYSLSLADVTATGGGTDYTSTLTNAAFSNGVTISGGTITVPADVTSFTVSVPTTADTIDEPNETYTLTVGSVSGTGTINDDDAAPTIQSVSSPSATEGSNLVYTVALTNPSSVSTTYPFTFGSGTATAGTDYTASPTFSNGVTLAAGVLTVPAGVTSFTITVPTVSDTIDEPNETVPITVGGVTGTGTINDDDPTPTISSVTSASATEAANIVHTVTLSNASSVATTYSLSLADVTATGGGTDYTSALTNAAFSNGVTISGGTITVPAGVTGFTVTVPTTADTIDEPNETYTLTVGGASGTGTINDDDAAPTISSVSSAAATEASAIVHTVTLSNASSVATTYSLALADVTATGGGTDYTSALTNAAFSNGVTIAGGVITVPAGVTSFTVSVPTTADTIDEPNETYTLTVGGASGTGTINDDDNAPTISSVSNASATEAASIVHTVTLSNASSVATTYSLALADVTATGGGTDYTSALTNAAFSNGVTISGGIITVPAGVTSFTVSVPTTADTIDEPNETYTLTVGSASGTGTINDDDAAPIIQSVSSPSATEGSNLVYTVALSNASSTSVTFPYSLGGGTATATTDYSTTATFSNGVTLAAGVLTVPAGVTSFTITVPTVSDTIDEPNETVPVTVGGVTGTGTINDDDPTPTISSVSSAAATEASNIIHTVTLSNASSVATTYSLALADVTATGGGTDYTSALTNAAFSNGVTISGGTITVPAGVTSFTVSVPTTSDTIDEPNETYTLTVGGASGTGTINDDDAAPTIQSVTSPSATEGSNLVYTVTLTNASSTSVTFPYALGGGTATATTDYSTTATFSNGVTLAAGVLTIPAGVTSFTITVPTVSDTIDEPNETVPVTVGGVTGTGTINDDDPTPTISSVTSASATEASNIVHTVTLSNASSVATTYSLSLADVTATGGGTDYTSALTNAAFSNGVTISGGTITVPAGVTSFTVSVPTTTDSLDEANETYTLTVGSASGTGTINDDDPAPTISISGPATINEAAGTATYTVTLSATSGQTVTVNYGTTAGTATAGSDYTSTSGTLSFAPGTTSLTFTVPITNDTTVESTETYSVSISSPTNATLGTASVTTSILDNDAAPVLDLDANNSSGATGANYTTSFTEGTAGAGISIADADMTITDADSTVLTGATIILTNRQTGDALNLGTDVSGITVGTSSLAGSVTVTLTGTATLAQYIQRIENLTFTNSSNNPSATPRTITVQVTDDQGHTSNLATTTVNMVLVNDPPAGRDATVTTNEDTAFTFSLSNFLMDDAEQGTGANPSAVRIDTLPLNGSFTLNGVAVTAGQIISAANITSGLLKFTPAINDNGNNYANFTFSVQDNASAFDTAPNTLTINVTPVNDGTPVAVADNYSTLLGTPITISQTQLLANDTLFDHARITGTGAVTGGALVNNGDGTWTFTPSAAGNGSFTYTLTDDDGQTSTATVSVTTYASSTDLITVNESALAKGSGGGVSVVSGNLLTNDPGATSITSVGGVTDGSASDTDARAGYIGVNQSIGGKLVGNIVVDVAGTGLGNYTYTLLDNADNSAAANNNSVTGSIAYVTNAGTSNAQVTIVDDRPIAYARTIDVAASSAAPSYNLVLVLDTSRSMTLVEAGGKVQDVADNGTVSISDRLTEAKAAMVDLVSAYFDQASNVSVKIVTFGPTATTLNGGAAYTDKATLIAAINGIAVSATGGTNYEAGLTAATTAFGSPSASVSNVAYFISDGAPTQGNTSTSTTNWNTFTATNNIKSYALGIGDGISASTALDTIHNVDADSSGTRDSAIIVQDLNDLSSVLTGSVPVTYGGSVVGGAASSVGSELGADGGWVQSITVQLDTNSNGSPDTNVTFNYNHATGQISWTGGFPAGSPITGDTLTLNAAKGFVYGTLNFDFETGGYSYYAGAVSAGTQFNLNFIAQDGDGDVTPSTALTFNVVNAAPTARPDFDTLTPNGTSFTGNVISGIGTDDGLPEGTLSTDFSSKGPGVDTIVDSARISSINFLGSTINLTSAAGSTALAGGTYTVSAAGVFTWTNATTGASLTFNRDGYYNYTPATADLPNPPLAAATNLTLTAAPASGLTITGLDTLRNSVGVTYTTGGNGGVGVTGSGLTTPNEDGVTDNSQVDNLETLVFTFDPATYSHGVENVSFTINAGNSNLGSTSSAGGSSSLSYRLFGLDGHLLGTFTSNLEGTVTLPSTYSNIGSIEIITSSDGEARVSNVSFQSVLADTSTTVVAPVSIGYTLTDSNGDASSSTLTLTSYNNETVGDSGNNTITGSGVNDQLFGMAGNDTLSGGAGHDLLSGGTGSDSLSGGDGDDKLFGGDGNDILDGGNGADRLIGGAGNDTMTGGAGSDTFVWTLADRGSSGSPAIDTITDFNTATPASGGDVLDLRDLLQGETHTGTSAGTLGNYLHFTVSGGNTTIHISSAGGFSTGFNASATDQQVVLQGVDLTNSGALTNDNAIIQNLLTNGKLQTD